MQFDKMKRQQ